MKLYLKKYAGWKRPGSSILGRISKKSSFDLYPNRGFLLEPGFLWMSRMVLVWVNLGGSELFYDFWWIPGQIIILICFYIWTFEPEDRNLKTIANDILCQMESCLDNMLSSIIQALISSLKKYYFGIDLIIL